MHRYHVNNYPTIGTGASSSDALAASSLLPLNTQGDFLGSGGQLVWRTHGPTVEVVEANSGIRIAAWTFGAVFKNTAAKVSGSQ